MTGSGEERVLVTGGAGFIGANLVDRLAGDGLRVVVLDNLSRPGVDENLRWLAQRHGTRLEVHLGDVRDEVAVARAVAGVDAVFHLAAQVAVTTSLSAPRDDFDVNARGTLNVLEAARALPVAPALIFTSTNKVYGALPDVPLRRDATRYEPEEPALRARGIGEDRPLEFHSPYGCSKGAADQYVLDWARSYGLRAVVFRMSCIYGPRQFGTEDQGWVAHFIRQALRGAPITVYGDGRQVRDVLYIDDLVDALLLARRHADRLGGAAFNIGGGPERTLSLLELLGEVERLHGARPRVGFEDWRTGDQRYYVSDTRRFRAATGWTPRVGVLEGVSRLHAWLAQAEPARTGEPRAGAGGP